MRSVPFARVAEAVGPDTTLVALSHVSWVSGEVAPAALAELDVPVILDGAQGAGAIHCDPRALGCVAYAASGQKWLCGADGTGFLWVDPGFAREARADQPRLRELRGRERRTRGRVQGHRRPPGHPSLPREAVALSLAAIELLESAGWEDIQTRAAAQARRLADRLRERGLSVMPRGATTLVAWEDPYAEDTRNRLFEAGVAIRDLPGRALLRASVGAWNDDADLERLLSAL